MVQYATANVGTDEEKLYTVLLVTTGTKIRLVSIDQIADVYWDLLNSWDCGFWDKTDQTIADLHIVVIWL